MDEPLSALDAKVRTHLRQEIKQLQKRLAVTTIMVTHDQEEALTMADRIVVMNHGVIEQIGTPEEIYAAPASEFVAEFIGTMNFINAAVRGASECAHQGGVLQISDNSIESNRAVRLAIRPEDVRLLSVSGSDQPNQTAGQVISVEYLGAFIRVTIQPAGWQEPLLVDASTDLANELEISAGGTVNLSLPAEKILIYQEDS